MVPYDKPSVKVQLSSLTGKVGHCWYEALSLNLTSFPIKSGVLFLFIIRKKCKLCFVLEPFVTVSPLYSTRG